jgi:alpha-galactosidase/6-phospho-beta-glucosidase family protein
MTTYMMEGFKMKIVLIGGGSFVFAPTVLEDAIVKCKLLNSELVLVDPNAEAVEAMAAAGRKISSDLGVALQIRSTSDRLEALPGADFVIVSASAQGAKRWAMDYEILKEHGMSDQARECGGLGGMLNTFRSVTLIIEICRDMERLCPNALLLDVTNPMPRVVTAIRRYTSIQGVGFCNIAYKGPGGYDFFGRLMGRKPEELQITTAGLNHFAWLLEMIDKFTGEDLMPLAKTRILSGDWTGLPEQDHRELGIIKQWLETYGAIAAGAVDHHGEYMSYLPGIQYAQTPPYHGDAEQRRMWLNNLTSIASGEADWQSLFNHPSWEHPVVVAQAVHTGVQARFDILNIENRGFIRQIPDGRIVEVPVKIEEGTIKGIAVPDLPEEVAKLCRVVSDVHELVVEASVKGDRSIAERAIDADPAITDKQAAKQALAVMLDIHADILPQFHSNG